MKIFNWFKSKFSVKKAEIKKTTQKRSSDKLPKKILFLRQPRSKFIKSKVRIDHIESITATGHHVWCDSDYGHIRKPIEKVPKHLLDDFLGREASHE